jgi:uncharacterized protein YacL
MSSEEIEKEIRSIPLHLTTLDKMIIAHMVIGGIISGFLIEYLTTGYIDNIPKSFITTVIIAILTVLSGLTYYIILKRRFEKAG